MPCLGVFFYGGSVANPNFSVLLQECHKSLQACALAVLLARGRLLLAMLRASSSFEEPHRAAPTEKIAGLAAIRRASSSRPQDVVYPALLNDVQGL
jgi:hypothetical protein